MRINNSEEANQYYKIVNDLVDQYIKKWKIKPSSLSQYLKPGTPKFESFILKNGLSDVEGIKRIVQDVIEDRRHMELDGIMTFECFINESIFELSKPTIEHEKVLADLFNTSVGHIELVEADKHIYEINDFGEKQKCVILSKSELKELKDKLVKSSLEKIKEKKVVLDNYLPYVYISLSDIISEDKFKEFYQQKLEGQHLIDTLSNVVGGRFYKEFKDHFIWHV